MSSLTSSSTDAQVWASYDDNASYEEDSDTTRALAFITACRILLQRRPKRTSHGGRQRGTEIEFNPEVYEREQERAQNWLAEEATSAASTGVPGVIFPDFANFRE